MPFHISSMWFSKHIIFTSLALMVKKKPSNYQYYIIFLGKRDAITVCWHTPRRQTNFYGSLKVSNIMDLQGLLINLQEALNLKSAVYIIDHYHYWRQLLDDLKKKQSSGKEENFLLEIHEITIFWEWFLLSTAYDCNKCWSKIQKEEAKLWKIKACK